MGDDVDAENAVLKLRIQQLEAELASARAAAAAAAAPPPPEPEPPRPLLSTADGEQEWPLSLDEYRRYGRQMIMPEIGLEGQLRLKRSKVLIVGLGGLGCPAAAYLAGAGIGTLGLIDDDTVEPSNLHRQILHSTSRVGASKVSSALSYLRDLNPNPRYIPHAYALTPPNAAALFADYDLILDCTDHPSLRYLISDTAVSARIPVVSASALRKDGQLIVLNSPPGVGPCYRCIWPRPPPPASVTSCGEGGVLGPVVGVMGVLQALEAVKVLVGVQGEAKMTVFSGWPEVAFRSVRMRGRRGGCVGCDGGGVKVGDVDYVKFCGGGVGGALAVGLKPEERVGVVEYASIRKNGEDHVLLDVRDRTQFGICHLTGSLNIPFDEFSSPAELPPEAKALDSSDRPVYVLCRLGNDSQVVTKMLKDAGVAGGRVWDVKGGIQEWARAGAREGRGFPEY